MATPKETRMSPANAFIDFVGSVAAAPTAAASSSAGAPPVAASSPTLMQIAFRHGPVGVVDTATPQGNAWFQVLTSLQRNGAPAYVEFDPVNGHVTRVLQPHVVQVIAITSIPDGVEVELQISHAKHYLRKSQPDYARLLAALKDAQMKKTRVAVTETPVNHDIFEVSALPAGDVGTASAATSAAEPEGEQDGPVAAAVVPLAQAQRLFDLMNSKVCCPAGAAAPCITFGYPDDGCWGRAHEMYRLMAAEGVIADKVWIYGSLRVASRNNPRCEVRWGWHVAPTLLVDAGGGRSETYVIDPSLFPGPVPRATWASVQGDPSASLVPSAGTVFHRSSSGGITPNAGGPALGSGANSP